MSSGNFVYPRKYWTIEEEKLLADMWFASSKSDILKKFPGRTWASLIIRASKLKFERDSASIEVSQSKKNSYDVFNLHKILDETPEAYYWAGFISADGSVTDKERLIIGLSSKDKNHLLKFCNFIGHTTNIDIGRGKVALAVQDKHIISKFKKKFNIYPNKTTKLQCPNIENDDLFLSFLIGFIDGDGCIQRLHKRKDVAMNVVGHKNCLDVFKSWNERIYGIFDVQQNHKMIRKNGSIPRLDSRGYARWYITNGEIIRELKRKAVSLGVPYMGRKWDLVNENIKSRYVTAEENRKKIVELFSNGMKKCNIARLLKIDPSTITQVLKGY